MAPVENHWIWAASALLLGFIPCLIVMARGAVIGGLIALELAGVLTILILVLLSVGFQQPSFLDLALALAFLSFAAGLVFVRFLEGLI